jgi:hypothetical protein
MHASDASGPLPEGTRRTQTSKVTKASTESVVFLSLCIPTYNRARKLDRLLHQLREIIATSQFRESVEVIISDNASTDDTKEVIYAHV